MKKISMLTLLVIMVLMTVIPVVNAATESELIDKIYAVASKYGVKSKASLERYFRDYPVTEEQADELIVKLNEADAIANGVSDPKKLTAAQKADLQAIANDVARITGATVVFKNGAIEIYQGGKQIERITFNNGKLQYTGNNMAIYICSGLAIVALASVILVIRKRKVNA